MVSAVKRENTQIEKVIATTPSQVEIWLACKIGGKDANKAYNESVSVRLNGRLNVKVLQEAFLMVLKRHDGMRSVVSPNGKSFLIFTNYSLPIRMRDVSGLGSEEKANYLKLHAEQTGTYHFNLTQGPLYVLDLIKLDEESHLLTFTGHHIVFDGWSLGVMLEELSVFYSGLVVGETPELPKPDRFGEYAQEFFNLTRKSNYKVTRDFWKAYLCNPVPDFVLPSDNVGQAVRTYNAKRYEQWVSKQVMDRSKAVAAKLGASLNLTLLAVFEIFLSDWTGSNDTIVGLPVAGQLNLNKQRLIGHCVNLLPLRSYVNPNESFVEYLQKRKEDYFLALEYSLISFGEMIKEIPLTRNPSRIPLVPVTFNIDTGMGDGVEFSGLKHELISNPKSFSNFEIVLNLFEASEGHSFEWTFNTALFSESTIEKASANYSKMIEAFLDNPNEKIEVILNSLSTPIEKNDTAISGFVSLGELLQKKMAAGGEKLAVVSAGQEYNLSELNAKVKSIATLLLSKGAGPGKIVGVHLERTVDLVASALAVIQIGACYMPIDSEYPEERVKFMLEDVDVLVFLTDNEDYAWDKLSSKKIILNNLVYENHTPHFLATAAKPQDPLFIVYTSGSTGTPKGVALSQQNLSDFLLHFKYAPGYNESDRVLGLSSISFDMSFMELVLPFVYGASLHLFDRFERRDSREIVKTLNKGSITKLYATPSHLKSILEYGLSTNLKGLTIISAGEPLQHSLAQSLMMHSGKVYNIYGPTETTIFSNIKEITEDTQEITIGRPVKGTTILLVNDQGKLITKAGELGEVYIGGKGVALGYLNRDLLNQERFIQSSPGGKPGRFYRSGDLAVWTEQGELICKGRMDQQVKIRGQRVELCEIENRIATDAAVEHVIVEKVIAENGQDELVALLSFKNGKKVSLDSEKWVADCKAKLVNTLPVFMIPSRFVLVEDFELNQNGKVDRKLARKFVESTCVKSITPVSSQTPEHNPLALEVWNLWKEYMNVSQDQMDSDFFHLGGHSLMAVDLISAIEKKFGINLPLSILFEHPTINSLSLEISKRTSVKEQKEVESSILVKFKEGDPEKVLFFIHGVGLNPIEIKTLNEFMDEDQTIWGLQSPSIMSNKTTPLDNIEEIARLYISELKKLGYSGNYKLLGNSFGGQIAFEMTKQLLQAGEEVKFLGMIDTVASIKPERITSIIGGAGLFMQKLLFEIDFLFDEPRYYFNYRLGYLKEKMKKMKSDPNSSQARGLKARIAHIENVNMKAWETYKHEFVDTTITLFLAEKKTFFVSDFKTFGWSDFAKQVKTIYMPGDHATMLKPPYGERFSKALQDILNSSN